MEKLIRLDKYLADMGKGTRSQIRDAAKKGRISVNGQTEKKTDRKISPSSDSVCLDGAPVSYNTFEYYMMNKPQGVVSATEDNLHRTVIDLLDGETRRGLFPVGRLDIDTEGLLLLTNDGELAHRLLAPKKHVDKQYYAKVAGPLPEDSGERIAGGMTLTDGTEVKPGRLQILNSAADGQTEILLTIQEGKFHQVKRMFEALDSQVTYLKRLSMGPVRLDPGLLPGQYRPLTSEEEWLLKNRSRELLDGAGIRSLLDQTSAVIFDLDGTLVDSMWMWKQIDIEYLGRFGYSCPPHLQKKIEGMSFSETAVYFKETFGLPVSLEEIKESWISMSLEKYRSQVPLKPGAGQLLEYLKERRIPAGIATSNGRAMVDAVLESLGIRSYFQVVATACEVAAGKPAPDIYLKVAGELGAEPSSCMVFEDVPAGIMAGKAAGMTVCAVEDAYSSAMAGEKARLADGYIRNFNEILE